MRLVIKHSFECGLECGDFLMKHACAGRLFSRAVPQSAIPSKQKWIQCRVELHNLDEQKNHFICFFFIVFGSPECLPNGYCCIWHVGYSIAFIS